MEKTVYAIGNKEVTAYIPKTIDVHNLEQVYDIMNDLFNDPHCFYTADEVKALKKDKNNIFLRGK